MGQRHQLVDRGTGQYFNLVGTQHHLCRQQHRLPAQWLGVSLEHNTGTLSGQADDRLYVSFSMPLGEGRDINSYLNTARRSARAGIRYSHCTSQDRGWRIAPHRL